MLGVNIGSEIFKQAVSPQHLSEAIEVISPVDAGADSVEMSVSGSSAVSFVGCLPYLRNEPAALRGAGAAGNRLCFGSVAVDREVVSGNEASQFGDIIRITDLEDMSDITGDGTTTPEVESDCETRLDFSPLKSVMVKDNESNGLLKAVVTHPPPPHGKEIRNGC